MGKMKKLFVAMLSLMLTFSLAACGSSGYKQSAESTYDSNGLYGAAEEYWDEDYGYYDVTEESFSNDSPGSSGAQQDTFADTNRKLIKTISMSVETEDFDGFTQAINSKVNELGGYVENLDTYNGSRYGSKTVLKNSSMTIRIPKDRADEFTSMIGEKGNITNQTVNVSDVTLTYVDIESRKESYEAEQKRILELLEKVETLEDIIVLEDKLSEIRYMLDSMESQLRSYDNKVDYTTIYLNINEVKVYTESVVEPETYGDRIKESFTQSVKSVFEGLKDFGVWFVGAVPGLIVFAIVALIIFLIVKAIVKAVNKSNAKKAQIRMDQYNKANQAYLQAQLNVAQMASQAKDCGQSQENVNADSEAAKENE